MWAVECFMSLTEIDDRGVVRLQGPQGPQGCMHSSATWIVVNYLCNLPWDLSLGLRQSSPSQVQI